MSVVTYCDRCEDYLSPGPGTAWNLTIGGRNRFQLCEKCSRELKRWVSAGPHPEIRNFLWKRIDTVVSVLFLCLFIFAVTMMVIS